MPPFAAVQVIAGQRHTRGTPPAVVETDPADLDRPRRAAGCAWADASVRASGERSDLSDCCPLTDA